MRIHEEQNELQKKVHGRICASNITFLAARPISYGNFCSFFRLFPSFRLLRFYVKKKFAPENAVFYKKLSLNN